LGAGSRGREAELGRAPRRRAAAQRLGAMNVVMLPMWSLSGIFFSSDRIRDMLNMKDILDEIRENLARLPDEELVRIVTVDRDQYRQEAVATATEELRRRRVVVPPPVVAQARAGSSAVPMPRGTDLTAGLTDKLPRMWPGFGIALTFLIAEVSEVLTDPEAAKRVTMVPLLIALAGWVYWIWCMRRIRAIILEDSGDPSVPPPAGVRSFFVLHNPTWVIKWAGEVAEFVNKRLGRKALDMHWPSVVLLAGLLLSRLDAALGLAVVFSVGAHLRSKLVTALGPMARQRISV